LKCEIKPLLEKSNPAEGFLFFMMGEILEETGMKFKVYSTSLVTVMLTLLVLTGCNGDTTPEKVYELTYNNFFPNTHYNSILAEQWIQEIEERSNGAIKITYFPSGALASSAKTYDAVVEGICDIGMSVCSYTPGRFPVSELVDMPHSYSSGYVATMVMNDVYSEFKQAEFDDVHVLYLHGHGPGVIFTTQKAVRTLEDLQGLTIRGTGVGVEIVQALGAQGVGKSQSEAYDLLSKGVVDGTFTPRETLKGWSQGEVVKYVTACTAVGNTSVMFVVMNKDKWDSLPSNLQKIITDVNKDMPQKHGKVWSYYDQAGIEYFLGLGGGREVISLSASEMGRWVTAIKPLIEKAVTDRNAKDLPATEIEKYINERVKYWSSRVPKDSDIKTYVESEVANWTK
jgi:TRAP-type C4-dicarboxylate transport system substrate-binding protein